MVLRHGAVVVLLGWNILYTRGPQPPGLIIWYEAAQKDTIKLLFKNKNHSSHLRDMVDPIFNPQVGLAD